MVLYQAKKQTSIQNTASVKVFVVNNAMRCEDRLSGYEAQKRELQTGKMTWKEYEAAIKALANERKI